MEQRDEIAAGQVMASFPLGKRKADRYGFTDPINDPIEAVPTSARISRLPLWKGI